MSGGLVIYDDRCRFCRRSVALLQALDRGGRLLRYEGSSNVAALQEAGLTPADADEELKVVLGGTVHGGYDGIVQAVAQLPVTSWAAPMLKLKPVRWAGCRIYRRVAARRKCRGSTCRP